MGVAPLTNPIHAVVAQSKDVTPQVESTVGSLIRVAAVHMVFASRTSLEFITPQSVDELETWTGKVRVIFLRLSCSVNNVPRPS
jgi:uridine phosphorylase